MSRTIRPLALLLALTASACGDDAVDADVVARAGDQTLRVDEVVDLMVDQEELPARADVVESLAELWIDYTLLARAAAEDSTLQQLDLRPLVQTQLEQEMLLAFRDSSIQVDTLVSEEDLRTRYEEDEADLRFRARHIMLRFPLQASSAQRDSVRSRLEDIRRQIVEGASFEELARRFSQDPGTASAGGDLGFFGPGDLVRPFEQAVRALDPGELSEVVETPMGLHLVRLEEEQRLPIDQVAGELGQRIRVERTQVAESVFVAGVEERAGELRVTEDAVQITRELAESPGVRLSGRAARRALVEWNGGALTAGRLIGLLRLEEQGFLQQVAQGESDALESFLVGLARRELMVEAARTAGLAPAEERVDSLVRDLTDQLRAAGDRLGLVPPERAPGEPLEQAVERAVREALEENLSGASPTVPLGPVAYQLRAGSAHATFGAGIGRAILEIGRARAARGSAGSDTAPGSPDAPADSAGS